jgi:thioredoxin reductase/ferredoxin
MIRWFGRYAHWLHLRWPHGMVEPLPAVRADGSTSVPGVYVAGDLAGVPLLKFALDGGARVAQRTAVELAAGPARPADPELLDLAIVGGGVAGMAAAIEARERGLRCAVLESSEPFSTIVNFPQRKPIYTYPLAMKPAGKLQVQATVKEDLLAELRAQAAAAGIAPLPLRAERVARAGGELLVHTAGGGALRARRVLVAIGRSGEHRRLGVPGEDLDHVTNRLHDPADFAGQETLVVGGGDSALETALALAGAGARVTLVHRQRELARPKPENLAALESRRRSPAAPGFIDLRLGTAVKAIRAGTATLATNGAPADIPADHVFTMIGRAAPLDFFRRSGVALAGERGPRFWAGLAAFLLFALWLYNWKSGGSMAALFQERGWFPFNLPALLAAPGGNLAAAAADPRTLLGTLAISAAGPAFWYTVAYSLLVVVFGIRRIRRRRTPYVTAQTATLAAIQVGPLFLLPEIILPLLHHNGWLPAGLADALFPAVSYGHGREFWRAYGLVLAWPLNVYNVFTPAPIPSWLAIAALQTLVLIPLGIRFYGKGVYCGWICSCGALAETLGDTARHKMPHGPGWNRLNMLGQAILAVAVILLVMRIAGWTLPAGNTFARSMEALVHHYKWTVDVFLAGVIGYGVYFWFSGRVWCRFFCPLAALMHVYARWSRFRIFADKKKCISCNVCTTVCHQGIDVMGFANKGLAMADPECVRCSACIASCPTGVLSFGQAGRGGAPVRCDRLRAWPVARRESA